MENEKIEEKLLVYTDGACLHNGSKNSIGGWGFIIRFDRNRKEVHSANFKLEATNQRMELIAVINALNEIKHRWPIRENFNITIYSDSEYVVKGASDWMIRWESYGWKRTKGGGLHNKGKPTNPKNHVVVNLDLWKQMFDLVKELQPKFKWVRGHSGNEYNEKCDDLANAAIDSQSEYYKALRIA